MARLHQKVAEADQKAAKAKVPKSLKMELLAEMEMELLAERLENF